MSTMMLPFFVLALTVLSSVLAVPFDALVELEAGLAVRDGRHIGIGKDSFSFAKEHIWIPAKNIPGSSRSPCPFLNTMANHGFLKRDGRNLSMDDFDNALATAVNFEDAFIQTFFTPPQFRLLGVLAKDQNHTGKTIDLEDLNFHGRNEHDASMSRLDKIQGDTLDVQPALVEKILSDTTPVDHPYLNTSSIGRTRVRRERDSVAAGGGEPDFNITTLPGVVEGALALLFLGEGGNGDADGLVVRKERLREWMNFERIPKGWRRSPRVVTANDLLPIVDRVKFWRDKWLKS